jgi:hypothetical protein
MLLLLSLSSKGDGGRIARKTFRLIDSPLLSLPSWLVMELTLDLPDTGVGLRDRIVGLAPPKALGVNTW